MPLGISDLKRVIILPGNWDLAYLRRFNGKEGARTSFDGLAREIATMATAFNGSLTQGYLSRFISVTESPETSYGSGGSARRLPKMAEHSSADPIVGEYSGHMIPMYDFGGALGWTRMALRRSPMSKFEHDLREVADRSLNTWEGEIINRMFSKKAVKVGNSGKSMPFLDGGVADPDYAPPSIGGARFAKNEQHYKRYEATEAGRIAYLSEAGSTLKKHRIVGPYDLIVSAGKLNEWRSLDDPKAKWIKPQRNYMVKVDGVEVRVDIDENVYAGAIETDDGLFMVYESYRVGGDYAHACRAYGFGATGNPIVVRKEEGHELGLAVEATINHYPFEEAQLLFTFGTGVGARANGFNGRFAATGGYEDAEVN